MGKKKQEQTTTATYSVLPHVATADENAYRASVNQGVDMHTPIVSAYGQAENDLNDTVFEDKLPAGVAERIKYGRMFNLRQHKAGDLGAAAGQEAQAQQSGLANLASMTQNQYAQTSGTMQGTQHGFFGPAFSSALGNSLGAA